MEFGDRAVEAARPRAGLQGREGLLRHVHDLWSHSRCGWLHLHGAGGIGKTTLLERLVTEASKHGCRVHFATVGQPVKRATFDRRNGTWLVIDDFEGTRTVRSWARRELLPHLDGKSHLVTAGRHRLEPSWHLEPWARSAEPVQQRVGELEASEAARVARAHGACDSDMPQLLRTVGGHPLALCLFARAGGETGALPLESVAELSRRLELEPDNCWQGLALGLARDGAPLTEQALSYVLGDPVSGARAFRWLCTHPAFVQRSGQPEPLPVARAVLRLGVRDDGDIPPAPPLTVMHAQAQQDREHFDRSVKAALRSVHHRTSLQRSDLLTSILAGPADAPLARRVSTLRASLRRACEELGEEGQDGLHARVLRRAYFEGPTKQLAAAHDLGMGYSTYRRHLTAAHRALADVLWARLQMVHSSGDGHPSVGPSYTPEHAARLA